LVRSSPNIGTGGASVTGSYLSVGDIAADLGVSQKTVYGWLEDGRGPERFKVGGLIRVSREAYARWLAEQRVDTTRRPA
jgi:excisionase family DNA binding protein